SEDPESEIKLRDINKKYGKLLTEYSNLEDGKNKEEIKNLKKELKETRDEKDKVEKDSLKIIEERNKEIKKKCDNRKIKYRK
ncbi:16474_t:CDS:2, partial [Gigaspora margarita]